MGRIQRRDTQGSWTVLIAQGTGIGQVSWPTALAVDAVGDLYVADTYLAADTVNARLLQQDAQGIWSVIADGGGDPGQVYLPRALAVDAAGGLYVADNGDIGQGGSGRIQKRDAQGNWSVIAERGEALGQVYSPIALAVDAAGNLYVADQGVSGSAAGRIQKRDAQGNWSVIATGGDALGQVYLLPDYYQDGYDHGGGLAVDGAGNLYVADTGNNRVQKYTPGGAQ
jgi:sugar lactone lactonase YvrE